MKKVILLLLVALVGIGYTVNSQTTWTNGFPPNSLWSIPGNWDAGVPDQNTEAIIPNGATGYPEIASSADGICGDLTIESAASISILETGDAAGTLTIHGDATNNGTISNAGTVILQTGASFLGNNPTGTGSVDVKAQITGGSDIWHLFSSPVQSITALEVFPGDTYVHQWVEANAEWQAVDGGFTFTPGMGYSANLSGDNTVTFSGDLNAAADVTISGLDWTPGPPYPNLKGYHLLGNPYPSALDLDIGTWAFTQITQEAFVWNESAGNYNNWVPAGTGDLQDGVIPPSQGFFVRVTMSGVTGASLTLPNDARVHSDIGFYKNEIANHLALEATGNSYKDYAAIHFTQEATQEFDDGFDSHKMFGKELAPQLYSIIEEENLSINSLPQLGNETVIVNMGFEVGASGQYTINANGMGNFESTEILFEDLKTGEMIDLNENDTYTFNYEVGEAAHRFNVHFKSTTGIDEFESSGINAYSFNNSLYVVNDNKNKAEVEVYNVMGQKVLSTTVNNGVEKFNINQAGCYIVKVLNGNKTLSKKIVLK